MMLKIFIWKCGSCGTDFEVFYNAAELKELIEDGTPQLCLCGGNLYPYNFKNNSQRWRFADEI
jgi:hypothetical protein